MKPVLEIGCGLRVLTAELAARAKLVLAIEKDYQLCGHLRAPAPGVELVRGRWSIEVLEDPALSRSVAVQGRIEPAVQHLHADFAERLVERADRPRAMVLTLQRLGGPATGGNAQTQGLRRVDGLHAAPVPRHHRAHRLAAMLLSRAAGGGSAIVARSERRDPRVKLHAGAPLSWDSFRAGFSQRRKMLKKYWRSLRNAADDAFAAAGISTTARAPRNWDSISGSRWPTRCVSVTSRQYQLASAPNVLSDFLPPQPLSLIVPMGFGSISNGGTTLCGQSSSSGCESATAPGKAA